MASTVLALGCYAFGCAHPTHDGDIKTLTEPGSSGQGGGGSASVTGGAGGVGGSGTSGSGGTSASGGSGSGGSAGSGSSSGGFSVGGSFGSGGSAGGGLGGSGGSGSSGNSTCTPVPDGPGRDADGDGLIDAIDRDDDNDGISDLEECFQGVSRFTNPGFEHPVLSDSWAYVHAANVGWETTDPEGDIELWASGNFDIESAVGDQFAEISANQRDTLSQEIDTLPGTTLRFAFYHRGRTGTDTLELHVGEPGAVTEYDTYSTGQDWVVYEGTYVVPAGQTLTRFEFRAITPDTSYGNLLDHADAEPICTIDSDGDGCVDTEDPD